MISAKLTAEMSTKNGTMWADITLNASEDPDKNYVDFAIDVPLGHEDVLMIDPDELRRALDVVAAERTKLEAEWATGGRWVMDPPHLKVPEATA